MMEHLAKVGASCTSFQESQVQAVFAGSSVVECICTPQVSISFFFSFYLFPEELCKSYEIT